MSLIPFHPLGSSVTVTTSTTTASAAIPTQGTQVLVYNAGTTLAYIKFDVGSATATATDMPLPPGLLMILTIAEGINKVAAILASGTGSVIFMRGRGI